MITPVFQSKALLEVLVKRKKHLAMIGITAAIAAAIFSSSFFMPPKYKSFALVYPSNLIAYSSESPTEQMLQIAQSSEIRNKVIRAFNLFTHYGIDTLQNKHYMTDAIAQYEDNITIKKTEFESMEITAFDTDPKIAAQIVDSIILYFNIKARELQVEKCNEVLVICENQMKRKKTEMDSMEVRLKELRTTYGILDYKSQSEEALRGLFRTLEAGSPRGVAEAQNMINSLKDKGGEFNELSEHLWRVRGNYNDLKVAYDNAYRDVHKLLTYTNVITSPEPADKKAWPIRWLIVLITVSTSLLLSFILFLIIDNRQEVAHG